ncbi:cyclophane-forming radical SAM/SPASM peptide maturase YhhB [Amycolatopsis sp. NPDC051128]|uniref:cyclophane-forming radical SAM/SPASM peptide maturase YhhB n=1 Tax=Amycolatopsis sp. NPDC051128 TaxID=3155412 RepID=UPI0034489F08
MSTDVPDTIAGAATFTTFLVKVAARCNLSCDYCYMYKHADQTWREQPHVISPEVAEQVAGRIGEYAREAALPELLVVFHGGEPLLAGAARLTWFRKLIADALPDTTTAHFSLQTNGVLLDDERLTTLADGGIGVSISLDGPATVNDRHRSLAGGGSSHSAVMDAIRRLRTRPETFAGVIAVIDPDADPRELLEFFAELDPPSLDLLLPDANHCTPPPGRDRDPQRYERWLVEAFDIWFDDYPTLPIRTFDAILAATAGAPSPTDAFGFGDVSLLCIETDGGYHDLDVLKITKPGQTNLEQSVFTSTVAEVARSPKIQEHRRLLSPAGVATECRSCPVVDVCGGGAVPHRYSAEGFANPTVYCAEMLTLISHVRTRLHETLQAEAAQFDRRGGSGRYNLAAFDKAATAVTITDSLVDTWQSETVPQLARIAEQLAADDRQPSSVRAAARSLTEVASTELGRLSRQPSVSLWVRAHEAARRGQPLLGVDGEALRFDPTYVANVARLFSEPARETRIHRPDPWLRSPFSAPIRFLTDDEATTGPSRVNAAMEWIRRYDAVLAAEILNLSPEVQFVTDESAHPDKVVSFSDDVVPGCLFIGLGAHPGAVDVYDLADSIIHEHRHQKLYLLEREVDLIIPGQPFVPSPWREELRPPSGLLHAAWVFVELLGYWRFVETSSDVAATVRSRAANQVAVSTERLSRAWKTLDNVQTTPAGDELILALRERSAT